MIQILLIWLATAGIALFVMGFIAGWLDAKIHYDHKKGHQ